MSLANVVMKTPWWYFLIPVPFSLYYAVRGIMEQQKLYAVDFSWSRSQKIMILYIQEVLFKVISTVSGFMALFIANYIFSSIKSVNEIRTGTAVLLIFLFTWGVLGISGYLTWLIVLGKPPTLR